MAVLAQEPFAAEYTTTTADGSITLGGRIGNYKTLAEAGVANTNVVMAEIRLVSGGVTTEYEMGFYTYASSGPTLTIVGSPLRSSNSNNKVSWGAGTKQVVLSAPPFFYPRDDRFVLVGSADWTKRARFEVDGITAGQTRVYTLPDADCNLGSGWEPIATLTASSSSSLDFEALPTTKYKSFLFVLTRILPATDGAILYFRVGTGSTTYQASGYVYAGIQIDYSGNVLYLGSGTSANQIAIVRDATGIGNQADEYYSGTVQGFGVGDAAGVSWVTAGAFKDPSGVIKHVRSDGQWVNGTPITAARFIMSSGNIASGSITAYGLRSAA